MQKMTLTDYMYQERREEEVAGIEDSVDASIQRLKDSIEKQEGGLITAIKNDTDNTMDKIMTITGVKMGWKTTLCAF